VRTSGECPSDEDVIKISKIFRDDLTLDNLSRAQIIAMCRYMNLNTFGTDALLRYNLRHHLLQIKRDDKAIAYEGMNSLSVPELQYATAARGIRTVGMSPARLRDDLQQWLDLRLKHGIPSTLLVLSNAYAYGQDGNSDSHLDNLRTTLSCLTDELVLLILFDVDYSSMKQNLKSIMQKAQLLINNVLKSSKNKKNSSKTKQSKKQMQKK
jgi:LETM1 and EF-hand domain-containing protein 1, mitochondrial